jgi:hypothetical protein
MTVQMQQGTTENPIVLSYEDSRKKMRTLTISGFIKPSGMACARITNDAEKSQSYFTRINATGDEGECSCDATCVCYHMQALFDIMNQLPTYDELVSCQIRELEIETEEKILNEAIKIVADAEKKLDADMYRELGKTKKTAAEREAEARKKAEQRRNNATLNGNGGFRMFK